jgi:hypothetical protein
VSTPGPVQIEYQNKLEEKIAAANMQLTDNPNIINTTLKTVMNEVAHDILEYKQAISKPTLFLKNNTIRSLLIQLKKVTQRMHRKQGYSAARQRTLKNQRTRLKLRIKWHVRMQRKASTAALLEEMESNKGNVKFYA